MKICPLLNTYVRFLSKKQKKIYGESIITCNWHVLTHLHQDYCKFGALDRVSCFKFESFLGTSVKSVVRGPKAPLHQIAEYNARKNQEVELIDYEFNHGHSLKNDANSFKSLKIGTTVFKPGKVGSKDNVVQLKSGKIGIIGSIHKENISVQCFDSVFSFFSKPVDSKLIGIYKVMQLSIPEIVRISNIHSKMLLIVREEYCVAFKLLHSLFP